MKQKEAKALKQIFNIGTDKYLFLLEKALKKNYWIFSQISVLFQSTILPVNYGKIISFKWLPRLAMHEVHVTQKMHEMYVMYVMHVMHVM